MPSEAVDATVPGNAAKISVATSGIEFTEFESALQAAGFCPGRSFAK
jgi:hypothetical protein